MDKARVNVILLNTYTSFFAKLRANAVCLEEANAISVSELPLTYLLRFTLH